jgi:DNA invertase Pin-like site-specific DNA recombinase
VRIGYMRILKADGSQVLDLQRDALLAAGVKASRLYPDHASGKKDDRPGLEACLKSLREADTLSRLEARSPRPQPPPPRQHHS